MYVILAATYTNVANLLSRFWQFFQSLTWCCNSGSVLLHNSSNPVDFDTSPRTSTRHSNRSTNNDSSLSWIPLKLYWSSLPKHRLVISRRIWLIMSNLYSCKKFVSVLFFFCWIYLPLCKFVLMFVFHLFPLNAVYLHWTMLLVH